jgi:hypothetical protein
LLLVCIILFNVTPRYDYNDYNNLFIIKSSVFDLERITALINNVKTRQDDKEKKKSLTESDYNLIMAAILPHYFPYDKK